MTIPTILAIFAHPDDELLSGGTLARYAASGARVVLACATGGEVGEISEPHLATRETLGAVRAEELHNAVTALGFSELRFLGFRDSGMVGTSENNDPRSLHSFDPQAATERFTALLRDIQPDVVVTHDPTGGYGHPDHIAVYRYTTAAFDALSDGPLHASRLFYGVMARSFFEQMGEAMKAAGIDTQPFNNRPDGVPLGISDEEITTSIDVSAQQAAKFTAFEAHRTQFGPQNPMRKMPDELRATMFAKEYFILVRPTPPAGFHSTDLLA
ncbi:MAG: PIG-L family deacetylase [Roseiflexaceae bacterium]|nr:PIG-L family deacetylase [Roseiflexaceae bacterium]